MDISGLFTGELTSSPRNEFMHYTSRGDLEGIRQGDWKLLIKKPRQQRNNNQANTTPPQILLFNLQTDLSETNNLAETHPDIVERLTARMTALDAEIAKNARVPWFKE